MRIGILSDTHGLLRPEAVAALRGVEYILHAGDVGDPGILDALQEIAPVTAIRGNIDTHGSCARLPETEAIEFGGRLFYLVHSLHWLDIKPESAGIACVVSGHSHQPLIETRSGVLYLNPGSCGPRRFKLPVTLALLDITPENLTPHLIDVLSS